MCGLKQAAPFLAVWQEHWHPTLIVDVFGTECVDHLSLLFSRQQHVGDDDDWKRAEREHGGPMHDAFAEGDEKESGVLWVAHEGIRPFPGQPILFPGAVHLSPARAYQKDP